MKRLVTTVIFICAISFSVLAGDIPSDGSPAPDPNPTPATEPAPGEIPTDGKAKLSSDALSAALSVLSFLV